MQAADQHLMRSALNATTTKLGGDSIGLPAQCYLEGRARHEVRAVHCIWTEAYTGQLLNEIGHCPAFGATLSARFGHLALS